MVVDNKHERHRWFYSTSSTADINRSSPLNWHGWFHSNFHSPISFWKTIDIETHQGRVSRGTQKETLTGIDHKLLPHYYHAPWASHVLAVLAVLALLPFMWKGRKKLRRNYPCERRKQTEDEERPTTHRASRRSWARGVIRKGWKTTTNWRRHDSSMPSPPWLSGHFRDS